MKNFYGENVCESKRVNPLKFQHIPERLRFNFTVVPHSLIVEDANCYLSGLSKIYQPLFLMGLTYDKAKVQKNT